MIKYKLNKRYSIQTRYFTLPDEEWGIYYSELPNSVKNEYRHSGYTRAVKMRNSKNILVKFSQKGIMCFTYKGLPIFKESDRKLVQKRFE